MTEMKGRRIAILATDGFEQVELTEPLKALKAAGAEVQVISPAKTKTPGKIQGMNHDEKADQQKVDATLAEVQASRFDGLVLPGGVANPDYLRVDPEAVAFVRHFVDVNKPIASICHGPWTLIEAGGVKGHRITSWPSLKTDLTNAGANWVDEQVVTDGQLVTSRKPDDLPAFCKAVIELFGAPGQSKAA